ncbi:DNA-processing protein DprA [Comamonas jiangduensis]|uniref:DNA-processing protein DprA n=1 Tax=Comamonas jiangduensis TaxID=1194168 RepID=UPI0035268C7C
MKLKGVGPAALKKIALIPSFESKSIGDLASCVPQIARSLESGARWDEAREWAEQQVEAARRHNAYILSAIDSEYPPLLAATKDDPFVIFVQGKLAKPEQRSVAVIGTREPTYHGSLVAKRLTTHFGEAGWSIVSGLAIGCDGLAHQAALDCGAHTVAVMAHGLHMTAPSKHRKLAQDILASGGAVISEYPFGQAVQSQQYVKRDRTQAGLALGVIMIQSDVKGGSLYASRATLEYGRWLAVPYPTDRDRERREPKVQANIVIADAAPHERADLLRCTPSALERVIVLRNRDDYWRLAESSGTEATLPWVDRQLAPTLLSSTSNDLFKLSSISPLVDSGSVQPESFPSDANEAAERGSEERVGQSLEGIAGSTELSNSASVDVMSFEDLSLKQDIHSDLIADDQVDKAQAADATTPVHIDSAAGVATVDAIEPKTTEKPRRLFLEVMPSNGEVPGAAFGLWLPPRIGSQEFKKHLGHTANNKGVREFYVRHRLLHTRLKELQRKLLVAKHPLKLDQVLALRLAAEEVVFHVSKLAIVVAAIETLANAERQRVKDQDWIEQSNSENQLSQLKTSTTSEMHCRLASEVSALLDGGLQSFIINENNSGSPECVNDPGAQWISLQLLVEQLNSILKSTF